MSTTHTITHLTGFVRGVEENRVFKYNSVSLNGEVLIAEDPYHFYDGRIGNFGFGEWKSAGELIANMVVKLSENGDAVKVIRKKGVWHYRNGRPMPFEEDAEPYK